MFLDRSPTKSILHTSFGAAHAMPVSTSIKVGDAVALFRDHIEVEVKITAELLFGGYRGIVVGIDVVNPDEAFAVLNLEEIGLKFGESIEFAERQIHRCMHQCM